MSDEQTVTVGWKDLAGKKVLVVDFGRELDVEQATRAAEEMVAEAQKAPEPVVIVWDCSRMQSYTAKAFEVWRNKLRLIRDSVDTVHCVTSSTFIRAGAVALGLSLGSRMKTWKTEAEIEL
jgi:hypothetical protein